MGSSFVAGVSLGSNFSRTIRRGGSLLELCKGINGHFHEPDWEPRSGIAYTDISPAGCHETYLGWIPTAESALGDTGSQNQLIDCFLYGYGRSQRGGSAYCHFLQYEDTDKKDLAMTEYQWLMNNDHFAETNMDRNSDPNSKSFIPVDIGKSFLNEVIAYYQTLFGHLPKEYYAMDFDSGQRELNLDKSMRAIESAFDVKHRFVFRGDKNGKIRILEANYVLGGGILLFLSEPFNACIALYDAPKQLEEILPHISVKRRKKEVEKPRFKLLVHSKYGFDVEDFDLKSFSVDVKDNYNDDLPDKKIRDFIESEGEAGLCILHGKPGTGKTYYIRDLIKKSKKEFIYMNKECLNYINDSSFIAFLTKSKNSVFIMEDCENVLASRTDYNNTISTLLNLSDGLLGDSLNNKFICTFNTDISNIDEALLRKGRMKVCYEFKYLKPEKANALAEKLNKVDRFDKEVPLCDVMNSETNGNEDIPQRKSRRIGF